MLQNPTTRFLFWHYTVLLTMIGIFAGGALVLEHFEWL